MTMTIPPETYAGPVVLGSAGLTALAATVAVETATAAPVAPPALPPAAGIAPPPWRALISKPEAIGPPKSILLYGFPGTRKTTNSAAIALVPGFNKVLFIDIDNGSEVLMNEPELRQRVVDGRIEIIHINSLDPESLAKLDYIVRDVTTNDYGYDAVILDTVDVGQDLAEKVADGKFATTGKGGTRDGFAVYREIGTWTNDIIRLLHDCPHLVGVVTAHAKEQTKESGAYRVLPTLSGSSKDSIGGIFSIAAYLKYENHPDPKVGTRHLVATVGESDITITKNRYRLPDAIVDFTIPGLYALIAANQTTAPAPAAA